MKPSLLLNLTACAALLLAAPLAADTVELTDGSVLKGKIARIEGGEMSLETAFAGTIKVKMAAVRTFSTDTQVNLAFTDGTTAVGQAQGSGEQVRVQTAGGVYTGPAANVTAGWLPGQDSPETAARKAAEAAAVRQWAYEVTADITGKSGNSDSLGAALGFSATLAGATDALKFYGRYNYNENDDVTTADDTRAGVDYSNTFSPRVSWYVRSELGRDAVKDINLWATAAGGLGYNLIDEAKHKLTFRAGLTYRYEDYAVRESVSSPGLEASLNHMYELTWGRLNSSLTYLPVFDDFGNFRVNHETSLELPLGAKFWKLRLGVANDYDSEPGPGVDELDTTYFTRLVLSWK